MILELLLSVVMVVVANDLEMLDELEFPGEHPPIGFPPSNDTFILLLDNGTWKYDNASETTFGTLRSMNLTIYEDFTWKR